MNEIYNFNPSGFRGITIIGDIHGNVEPFRSIVRRALRKKFFVLALGDIIDYGLNSTSVVSDMGNLISKDRGLSLRGNHENKFQKYLRQLADGDVQVKLKGGVLQTLAELESMTKEKRQSTLTMMEWVFEQCPLVFCSHNLTATHAALEPSFWEDKRMTKAVRNAAMYGQLKREQGEFPQRIYEWVNNIPAGEIVVVGHQVRSTEEPLIEQNDQGGKAIFLDGGSSKGGNLFSMDFILEDDRYVPAGWKMN